jgi:hypothetical protein
MSSLAADRTWLQRNTKWIVLGAIGGGLLLLCGFIAAILMLVSAAVRSSDVHETSVARAQADSRVLEVLGAPVEAGYLVSGSIQIDNDHGSADIAIPLSGPVGSARLTVVAEKRGGRWSYDEMLVTPDASGTRPIDLLDADESDAARANLK